MELLGIERGSSRRERNACNCRAISPALAVLLFESQTKAKITALWDAGDLSLGLALCQVTSLLHLRHNGLTLVLSRRPSCPTAPNLLLLFPGVSSLAEMMPLTLLSEVPSVGRPLFSPQTSAGPQSFVTLNLTFPAPVCLAVMEVCNLPFLLHSTRFLTPQGGLLLALLYLAPLLWKALNNNL